MPRQVYHDQHTWAVCCDAVGQHSERLARLHPRSHTQSVCTRGCRGSEPARSDFSFEEGLCSSPTAAARESSSHTHLTLLTHTLSGGGRCVSGALAGCGMHATFVGQNAPLSYLLYVPTLFCICIVPGTFNHEFCLSLYERENRRIKLQSELGAQSFAVASMHRLLLHCLARSSAEQ